jgi:DNA repair protein RecO (recombination protein O)
MLHKTRGIVLRCVRFGETSVICTVFTELLGLQSYMVKGVRTQRSGSRKANQLFPSSMLDMVVQRQPQKNLQHIREYQPTIIYTRLQEDVHRHGIALFAIEVVSQLLVADDPQPALFDFLMQFLIDLDTNSQQLIANFPLFFVVHCGRLAGYHISGTYSALTPYPDLREGRFSEHIPDEPPVLEPAEAERFSAINSALDVDTLAAMEMNGAERQRMLQYLLLFLRLHVPHFRELKTLPVLTAILY